jgi:hypothetical protein
MYMPKPKKVHYLMQASEINGLPFVVDKSTDKAKLNSIAADNYAQTGVNQWVTSKI